MKNKWKVVVLFLVLVLSLSVLTGCQKDEVKADEEEKVFSLEKTETEAAPSTDTKEELHYVLYLKVENTPYLMDDLQVVPEGEMADAKNNLPLYTLNKLFAFTSGRGLTNPIPDGTRLIKLEVIDGLAKVNLSKAFVPNQLPKEDAQLAVAAIVNTLTYFAEIDFVEIDIEGIKLNNYFGLDVSENLIFFENLYPEK